LFETVNVTFGGWKVGQEACLRIWVAPRWLPQPLLSCYSFHFSALWSISSFGTCRDWLTNRIKQIPCREAHNSSADQ